MDWSKLLSARFLATVGVISTFCVVVLYTIVTTINKTQVDPSTKELVMLIIGAFISTVSTITTFYFMRNDRITQDTTTAITTTEKV
jgi:hypothetical protein